MMKFQAVAYSLALVLLAGCSDDNGTVCTPGTTQTCACAGGKQGVQSCDKDGKAWGACTGCATAPDGGTPDGKVTSPDGKTPSPDGKTPSPDKGAKDGKPPSPDSTPSGCSNGWCIIPAGSFKMGAPVGEPCKETLTGIKETQHPVSLTNKFEIGEKEVTQGEYKATMGTNPSSFTTCGTTCPVDKANWHMAAAYCNALSKKKSLAQCYTCSGSGASITCAPTAQYKGAKVYSCKGYRLPTEAEWEYAYRAGTTTALYNGAIGAATCNTTSSDPNADKIGWHKANSSNTTHPVGQKTKNAWGLYDMAGNLNEWCHDWFKVDLGSAKATNPVGETTGTAKVIRGGSWQNISKHMRAANRNKLPVAQQSPFVGFRCARTLN